MLCNGFSPTLQARFSTRALPPLPARDGTLQEVVADEAPPAVQDESVNDDDEPSVDFASSIEKVKDVGLVFIHD